MILIGAIESFIFAFYGVERVAYIIKQTFSSEKCAIKIIIKPSLNILLKQPSKRFGDKVKNFAMLDSRRKIKIVIKLSKIIHAFKKKKALAKLFEQSGQKQERTNDASKYPG